MEKAEKVPLKTNSSVPDVVFHQLKMNKEERIIGLVDNDSEEHFGKLVRQGGETLLTGVFPQKRKAPEKADVPIRKGGVKVRLEIPASDTELETMLFYGSSSDVKCVWKEEVPHGRKIGNGSDETKKAEDVTKKKQKLREVSFGAREKSEALEVKTAGWKRSQTSEGITEDRLNKEEARHPELPEVTLQTEQLGEEAEATAGGTKVLKEKDK